MPSSSCTPLFLVVLVVAVASAVLSPVAEAAPATEQFDNAQIRVRTISCIPTQ